MIKCGLKDKKFVLQSCAFFLDISCAGVKSVILPKTTSISQQQSAILLAFTSRSCHIYVRLKLLDSQFLFIFSNSDYTLPYPKLPEKRTACPRVYGLVLGRTETSSEKLVTTVVVTEFIVGLTVVVLKSVVVCVAFSVVDNVVDTVEVLTCVVVTESVDTVVLVSMTVTVFGSF